MDPKEDGILGEGSQKDEHVVVGLWTFSGRVERGWKNHSSVYGEGALINLSIGGEVPILQKEKSVQSTNYVSCCVRYQRRGCL